MKDSLLIVDDEKNILDSLSRVLLCEDYEIFTAENALAGLEILEKVNISLVLSDYKMPGMDGISFFNKVKEISPDTMRIMFTGCTDQQVAISAINQGEVYRFITKPIKPQEIKLTIRQSLDYRDLVMKNGVLDTLVKKQGNILNHLEQQHPGITQLKKDDTGAIIISEDF